MSAGAAGTVDAGAGALRAAAVLSLDAPLVALPWAALLARAAGSDPRPLHLALLASGVWLGYAADRWLDGRRLGARAATARHRFAARHRGPLLGLWIAVFGGSLALAWAGLEPGLFVRAVALAALVGLYTVATSRWPETVRRVVPREVAVGLLFAAAVALFAWPDGRWTAERALLASVFAVLCLLDTATVAVLERDLDAKAGEHSLARARPGVAVWLDPACGALATAAGAVGILVAGGSSAPVWLALASASLLLTVARRRTWSRVPGSLAVDGALALPALLALPFAG